MTQFLDKTGLQYYTTKIKQYIQAQTTTGISKSEADKTYVAKTDLTNATSSKAGLMAADDKYALDAITEKVTDKDGYYYKLKSGVVPGTYYNITSFDGFVSTEASTITLGSSSTINQDKTVYNNTTNTFIGKTVAGKYYANFKDAGVQGEWGSTGSVPYTNHFYIDSTTGIIYSYNGKKLSDIHNYVTTTDIDEIFK